MSAEFNVVCEGCQAELEFEWQWQTGSCYPHIPTLIVKACGICTREATDKARAEGFEDGKEEGGA